MTLTPEEIAEKEFAFGLRGYDQEEVRAFLLLVAAEVRSAATVATDDEADAAAPVAELTEAQAAGAAAQILQKAHDDAGEIVERAEVDAELTRSRARAILTAAQDEALRLVAEAHARIDRRTVASNGVAVDHVASPTSTVEQLGEEISAMVQARDVVLQQLQEAKALLDHTVEVAEADPVLRRSVSSTA